MVADTSFHSRFQVLASRREEIELVLLVPVGACYISALYYANAGTSGTPRGQDSSPCNVYLCNVFLCFLL